MGREVDFCSCTELIGVSVILLLLLALPSSCRSVGWSLSLVESVAVERPSPNLMVVEVSSLVCPEFLVSNFAAVNRMDDRGSALTICAIFSLSRSCVVIVQAVIIVLREGTCLAAASHCGQSTKCVNHKKSPAMTVDPLLRSPLTPSLQTNGGVKRDKTCIQRCVDTRRVSSRISKMLSALCHEVDAGRCKWRLMSRIRVWI